jgi:hypothetical protein
MLINNLHNQKVLKLSLEFEIRYFFHSVRYSDIEV